MDEAINFLNVEIGVFLRYLRCFSKIENVQINKMTLDLMRDAMLNMQVLSRTAQIIENSPKNDVDFLFDLNEQQYELQRHILCRTCYELFPLSKNEFMEHVKTENHITLSNGSNSFSSEFYPVNESTILRPNSHSDTPSPDQSVHQLSCDQGFVEDNNFAPSNGILRYSDIVRTTATETASSREDLAESPPTKLVKQPMPMTLGDSIRTSNCQEAISLEIVDFITCTNQRAEYEVHILHIFTQSIQMFDPKLKVTPIGSIVYGFHGSKTNYNILIDTRKSEKSPALLMRSFTQYFVASHAQGYFDLPHKISSNRVLKQQLKLTHKESLIECFLLFDNDISVSESAKIIRDFITLKPICHQLIAYVRAWQNVVNDLAMQHGNTAFQFNTYIISVLVIFFLQVNYGIPVVSDASILVGSFNTVQASQSIVDETKDFDRMLNEFFHFYGTRYEINNHLISARIGRWQEIRLAGQQKHFSAEQKRLRDGINVQPLNWQKCTMFVQDLCSPGLNVTAEIPKEEVYNFQEMCQMFSTSRKVPNPKQVLKVSPQAKVTARRAISLSSLIESKPDSNRTKTTRASKPNSPVQSAVKSFTSKRNAAKTSVLLDNAIKDGKIFETIAAGISKFSTRSDDRIRNEARILGILKQLFKSFDRTLALHPFGSTTFGFGSTNSNYNILVDTRKSKQDHGLVLESFEQYLASTDGQQHFHGLAEIPASRTLKQQLRMIHKESGIRVLLLADDIAVAQTPKIIRDFIAIKPICRNLIEHILAWQNAVNSIFDENGAVAFQFNTYMISVLVIFFMQVNYEVPTLQDIAAIRSKPEAMKKAGASLNKDLECFDKILSDFFYFYGNRYQIWNHVISLSIGRWQERRIQDQQKFFLPNQKSLRDGISSNLANWKNCTMYVQDLVRPGVNIAAEVTTKDAYGFQEMCQKFAKKSICQKICQKDLDPYNRA